MLSLLLSTKTSGLTRCIIYYRGGSHRQSVLSSFRTIIIALSVLNLLNIWLARFIACMAGVSLVVIDTVCSFPTVVARVYRRKVLWSTESVQGSVGLTYPLQLGIYIYIYIGVGHSTGGAIKLVD